MGLLAFFERADGNAVPVGLAEHIAYALAFGSDAVSGNAILLDEDVLDGFGAFAGEAGVDFGIAFGRSVTLDDHLAVLVVLHVGGNALYVGQLGGVNDCLALAEGDDGFEGHLFRLRVHLHSFYDGLAVACIVELVLEIANLSVHVVDFSVLLFYVAAQAVDGGVEGVNLALVVELGFHEVVFAVACLEVVGHAGGQFHYGVVDVVLVVAKSVDDGGFEGDGPCLLLSNVEIEVQTHLRGELVVVLHSTTFKVVVESNAYDTFQFEGAGYALVSAEPVCEVHFVQEVDVGIVHDGFEASRLESSFSLKTEAPYGSNLLRQFETSHAAEIVERGLAYSLGDYAAVDSDGPVVEELVCGHLRVGAQHEKAQRG